MMRFYSLLLLAVSVFLSGCELPRENPLDPGSTVNQGDTTPPEIISIVPENGSGAVEPDASVIVTFSETMNRASVESGFSLVCGTGVEGVFAWSNQDSVLTFSPLEPLHLSWNYSLSIGAAVADIQGNLIDSEQTGEFSIRGLAGIHDNSFGSSGLVIPYRPGGADGYSMNPGIFVDDSARIFTAGYGDNGIDSDMVVLCFLEDGTPDTSFGDEGRFIHHNAAGGNGVDQGCDIIGDSSGDLIIAGFSRNSSGNNDMVIWSCDAAGVPDSGFGSGGVVVYNGTADSADVGLAVAIDDSGRILGTGYVNTGVSIDMAVWRYMQDGTPDSDFSGDGIALYAGAAGGSDRGEGIIIGSDNKIFISGSVYNGSDYDMALWCFNPDGSPDTDFGTGGVVLVHNRAVGNGNERGLALCLDSLDRILVTGESWDGLYTDLLVWCYSQAGNSVSGFGTSGFIRYGTVGDSRGYGVTVDSAGLIIVAGYTSSVSGYDMTLLKYYENGTPAPDFGTGGVIIDGSGASTTEDDYGSSVLIDNRGRLLVSGYGKESNVYHGFIHRYE